MEQTPRLNRIYSRGRGRSRIPKGELGARGCRMLTIPSAVTQGSELVVLQRKEYERLQHHLSELKDAVAKIRRGGERIARRQNPRDQVSFGPSQLG